MLLAEEYHQVMAEIENKNGHYKNLPNLKKQHNNNDFHEFIFRNLNASPPH